MGMYTSPEDAANEILSQISFDDSIDIAKAKILPIIEREMKEEYKLGGEHMIMMAEDGLGIVFSFDAVVRYQKEYQEYLDDKSTILNPWNFETWFLDKIQVYKHLRNNLIK